MCAVIASTVVIIVIVFVLSVISTIIIAIPNILIITTFRVQDLSAVRPESAASRVCFLGFHCKHSRKSLWVKGRFREATVPCS